MFIIRWVEFWIPDDYDEIAWSLMIVLLLLMLGSLLYFQKTQKEVVNIDVSSTPKFTFFVLSFIGLSTFSVISAWHIRDALSSPIEISVFSLLFICIIILWCVLLSYYTKQQNSPAKKGKK
jgi:bacteriorhodopsin